MTNQLRFITITEPTTATTTSFQYYSDHVHDSRALGAILHEIEVDSTFSVAFTTTLLVPTAGWIIPQIKDGQPDLFSAAVLRLHAV